MEYANLECKEVLTLDSLAAEMVRMNHIDNGYALEALLSEWKQGCDATMIIETARKMLDACTTRPEPAFADSGDFDECMTQGGTPFAGMTDLDAYGFNDLDAAGFSDFYGGDEDAPRACSGDRAAGGCAAAGLAAYSSGERTLFCEARG
jgi:hypothetical protein